MANSVTARFNDDCKVFVSMSDDTTVEKAVIIDAEGNETDIGGGESDFSTAIVKFIGGTVDNDKSTIISCIDVYDEILESIPVALQTGVTSTFNLVLYKGKQILGFAPEAIESYTGSVIIDQDEGQVIVTGDAEITVYTSSSPI